MFCHEAWHLPERQPHYLHCALIRRIRQDAKAVVGTSYGRSHRRAPTRDCALKFTDGPIWRFGRSCVSVRLTNAKCESPAVAAACQAWESLVGTKGTTYFALSPCGRGCPLRGRVRGSGGLDSPRDDHSPKPPHTFRPPANPRIGDVKERSTSSSPNPEEAPTTLHDRLRSPITPITSAGRCYPASSQRPSS
jgi:hypothetical protein